MHTNSFNNKVGFCIGDFIPEEGLSELVNDFIDDSRDSYAGRAYIQKARKDGESAVMSTCMQFTSPFMFFIVRDVVILNTRYFCPSYFDV